MELGPKLADQGVQRAGTANPDPTHGRPAKSGTEARSKDRMLLGTRAMDTTTTKEERA